MKGKLSKRFLYYIVLISNVLSCLLLTGCFYGYGMRAVYNHNEKPDDEISKSIKKALGKKVYYQGKDVNDDWCRYTYLIKDYDDENLIQEIIDAVEEAMEDTNITYQYISIVLVEAFPGATETVASISNYYEEGGYLSPYDGFQSLAIRGTTIGYEDSRYNNASTYITLNDIKDLTYTPKIQKSALDEGIVWTDIWPELERCRLED